MSSLSDTIAAYLPSTHKFLVVHLQSHPKQAKALVIQRSAHAELTVRSTHFVMLSYVSDEIIPLFGIELNVYLSVNPHANTIHKTLFVSKADTTGMHNLRALGVKVNEVVILILKHIVSSDCQDYLDQGIVFKRSVYTSAQLASMGKAPVNHTDAAVKDVMYLKGINPGLLRLIRQFRETRQWPDLTFESSDIQPAGTLAPLATLLAATFPDAPTFDVARATQHNQISLFTKAADQYLFPESFKNTQHKHVLAGDQLLRWWMKIIDTVVVECFSPHALECKLLLPGAEPHAIQKYFPDPRWTVGSIFHAAKTIPAVYAVPLFPDDPKGRFLEHLIVENRAKQICMETFWVELSIRQEFRLGDTVGVIGVHGELNRTVRTRAAFLSLKSYHKVRKILSDLDYSSPEGVGNALHGLLEGKETFWVEERRGERTVVVVAAAKRTVASPTVNNLTSMVRKKPKKGI
ncbi:hypothetical protein BABINDRAFT_95280 [Babjeviella inositovora NRRL Y-12698]|uniref:histone acetyltransferase n=1 Tax=Babjeviella inositovora NRRL Y-12698 TaxID=984486 RepID=A0A1E3QJP7_9ASCO|nr:uncharacterized protein BABINDRAFT_95280 [Babjeviella inositovora NRRL Y-12698]ODQ77909.1 hypothetical protein BABINDRAFT_95280 [Babjeviella inositovora NRRL Y-12698]